MKKLFKKLAIAATAATMTFAAAPAKADEMKNHQVLWNALERAGVEIVVNHQEACDDNWGGAMYMTFPDKKTAIVICQDEGANAEFNEQVTWTANDLDSLRHEAQHVVQDCKHGVIGDNILDIFLTEEGVRKAVNMYLTEDLVKMITENYDQEDHWIEYEAFAVAAGVSPLSIADAVDTVCR